MEGLVIPGALPISNGARSTRRDGMARPHWPAHRQHAKTLYSSGRQPRDVPRTRPLRLRAAASAGRPTASSGLLLISNFARDPIRHLRPRCFFALRTFAWQLALGRRPAVSYTQQIYLPSNSYGIVG